MKRMISVLLMAALLCTAVAGCSKPAPVDALAQFLVDINAGDYTAAYDLLHSSARYDEARQKQDEAEGETQPEDRINPGAVCTAVYGDIRGTSD